MSRSTAPTSVQVAHELRVVVGRLRRLLQSVAPTEGLSTSQTSVLSRLDRDGPATASGLAAAELVRPQSMAALLAVLDQRGLIHRSPDPDDGRRQLVSLSEQAIDLISGNRQARQEWLARAVEERYTEDEQRTLLTAFGLLERLDRP